MGSCEKLLPLRVCSQVLRLGPLLSLGPWTGRSPGRAPPRGGVGAVRNGGGGGGRVPRVTLPGALDWLSPRRHLPCWWAASARGAKGWEREVTSTWKRQ